MMNSELKQHVQNALDWEPPVLFWTTRQSDRPSV